MTVPAYFAWKMRSAVLWRVFERTGDMLALTKAPAAYRMARKDWAEMAEDAKAIYVLNITFGDDSNKRGYRIDRLPDIDGDIEDIRKKLDQTQASGTTTGNQAFIREACGK